MLLGRGDNARDVVGLKRHPAIDVLAANREFEFMEMVNAIKVFDKCLNM